MRPFEKECLGAEMKVVVECGIKDKCEVWREQFALAILAQGDSGGTACVLFFCPL